MYNIHQMKFVTDLVLKDIEEKLSKVCDPEKEQELLEFQREFEKMKIELETLILIEKLEAIKELALDES